MKKLFASAILLIALSGIANAQRFTVGGKAGANLNKITGMAFKEEYKLGYHVGAFAEIDLNKTWGIQPELIWNQINTRPASGSDPIFNDWQDSTGNIQLQYLSIPILLRYNIGSVLTLHLGPQFSILASKDKTVWNNGKEAFKTGDFAMVGGVQVNLGHLRAYGRYNVGLNNLNDVGSQDKWKSQQLQFGVGVAL